jgi:hypothetical protein
MIRIATEQRMAAMPSAARAVPVLPDLSSRKWFGDQAAPCTGATHGTNGYTAKRSTRLLGRPST